MANKIKINLTVYEFDVIAKALLHFEDSALSQSDSYIKDYESVVNKLNNEWFIYYNRWYRNYKIKRIFRKKGI